VTDTAFKQGWQPQYAIRRNGKHIAVIGAGPAGLACADQLNKAGCEVTVFDKQPVIGGLLASGVPPFKLDKGILVRRHQLLEQQGVHFRLGMEVDEALLQELLSTHDAIFLGTGTQTSRDLQLPGQQLPGVTDALGYLQQVNHDTEHAVMADKHVLVIGAGDSAMDCARSAVRQGAAEVTVAYRGEEQVMRASPKEKQAAFEEGVFFRVESAPTHVLGDEAVTGVRFNTPGGGQETIACDVVILAVGQVPRPPAWLGRFDVQTDEQGIIRVDGNGRTSNAKIYAGGDNTNGSDLVVTAIAAGRQAAHGILESFRPTRSAQESIRSLLRPPAKKPEPRLVAARSAQ
jgi:glutamate synthase (NADPH/NADH) small chain